ncbi:MAG: DUF2971 domain-containing protein [Pseudoalteromonas distincta]|uniref:DUF2971 domain-containing protein n=1 Tax=Pseudoalteromonas prydzensis TaxID=182141 RepID=UPI003FD2041D
MSKSSSSIIDYYNNKYPSAESQNIEALFRYSAYNPQQIERHKKLFVDGWLFHNLPCNFNDPFEFKPKLNWPERKSIEESGLILDLTAYHQLFHRTLSEPNTKQLLRDKSIQGKLKRCVIEAYQSLRVCCFTTSHENPLSWAHYADSHRGYCIKFSGRGKVASQARRINYTDNYPELTFPLITQMVKFLGPMLSKSKTWEYENEYRSIFNPNHERDIKSHIELTQNIDLLKGLELKHDCECLSLEEDEITDIYFGVNMPDEHKKEIKRQVKKGPFTPEFWTASISDKDYKMLFHRYK